MKELLDKPITDIKGVNLIVLGIGIGIVFTLTAQALVLNPSNSSDLRNMGDENVMIWNSIENAEIIFEEHGIRLDCKPRNGTIDHGTIYKCSTADAIQ